MRERFEFLLTDVSKAQRKLDLRIRLRQTTQRQHDEMFIGFGAELMALAYV